MNKWDIDVQRNASVFWFTCVDIDVLEDERLTPIEKVIFSLLCRYANLQNRAGYPSIKTLAHKANCSEFSVQKAIKRLVEFGIIERQERFVNGRQTTSLYTIIGFKASCYKAQRNEEGSTTFTLPPTTLTDGGQRDVPQNDTSMKYIKDSLTRGDDLPENSNRAKTEETPSQNISSTQSVIPPNPKEIHTPDDAPDALKQTAEYFLFKTERSGLTDEDISALRTLNVNHTPNRILKEIDKACDRFRRRGQPLTALTFEYIASALKNQNSRKKHKDKAKTDSVMTGITSIDIESISDDIKPEENERIETEIREGRIL